MAWDLLVGSAVLAFVTTLVATRWVIRLLRHTTMVGHDLHKFHRPLVPEMGGLAVVAGFYAGVTMLEMFATDGPSASYLHASLVAAFGAAFAGFLDDLFRLRHRAKAILPALFAVPLGIVAYRDPAGGTILLNANIGPIMLLAIPLGVTSAANAANMLEGFNGLGVGLGIIMSVAMIALGLITGDTSGLFLLLPLLGALLAFLYFNRYPAKVFPGDSMTLFVGATLAAAAILVHEKTYGALLFAPFVIEFALKARGRFRAENYGALGADGRLEYDGPIQSLAHAIMHGRHLSEWQVVGALWGLEVVVCVAVVSAVVAGL